MPKIQTMLFALLLLAAGALAGCVRPGFIGEEPPPPMTPTDTPEAAPAHTPAPPDPSRPDVLITQETDAGPLYLIRYEGGQGLCVALTFDPQTLAANRCGLRAGAGVGFVETLTAPDGRAARVAFGLAPNDAVTAVAVEFTSGANAPAVATGGGYLLVLEDGQTPRRATAIDQFGYMAGQWGF